MCIYDIFFAFIVLGSVGCEAPFYYELKQGTNFGQKSCVIDRLKNRLESRERKSGLAFGERGEGSKRKVSKGE